MASLLRKTVRWLPVGFAFNEVFLGAHRVSGNSMSPTLNPPESSSADVILVDRLSFRLYKYRRGEVVVLRSPNDPHKLLVKRVIGLEGDWVQDPISAKINKIPKGACWVEGDNAFSSEDSRTTFGPVPLALLKGRALAVCWPPSRWNEVTPRIPPGRIVSLGHSSSEESNPWWT